MRIENSFIPVHGIGEVTEQKLWKAGISSWDDFDGSVVGETRATRINEFISTAERHLKDDDIHFFAESFPSQAQLRMYENYSAQTCFLDIETTGLSRYHDDVTVVSLHKDSETTSLVRGMNLTRQRLEKELRSPKLLVTFNGKQFDVPFLEQEYDISIDIPHIDLRYPCQRLDLTGGLKQVETAFNIPRSRSDIDGRDAVRLWKQYQRGDVDALNDLVAYNREDTKNLQTLMDRVSEQLHTSVYPGADDSRRDQN